MIRSINDLNKYLDCLDELSRSEMALSNLCTINYLTAISVESILAQIDPWLLVKDHTCLCVMMPMIEKSVLGVKSELSARYGIGIHNP